jgi:hypothetical protein
LLASLFKPFACIGFTFTSASGKIWCTRFVSSASMISLAPSSPQHFACHKPVQRTSLSILADLICDTKILLYMHTVNNQVRVLLCLVNMIFTQLFCLYRTESKGYLCLNTNKFINNLRRRTGISARKTQTHGLRDTSRILLIRRRMEVRTVTGSCVTWGGFSDGLSFTSNGLPGTAVNHRSAMRNRRELQGNRNVMWLGCH